MRGKGDYRLSFFLRLGITPAYAGKSLSDVHEVSHYQDHPRLCGEKYLLCGLFHVLRGSPPPMRGKEHLSRLSVKSSGITPAYAGKSKPKL